MAHHRALEELPVENARHAFTSLAATPQSPAAARRFIRDCCLTWNCGELTEHAQLLTSELVTNAVVHANTSCQLAVRLDERALRLEVTDESREAPSPVDVSAATEQGRGLFVVAALATAWGVVPAEDGKTVWAELARALAIAGVKP